MVSSASSLAASRAETSKNSTDFQKYWDIRRRTSRRRTRIRISSVLDVLVVVWPYWRADSVHAFWGKLILNLKTHDACL